MIATVSCSGADTAAGQRFHSDTWEWNGATWIRSAIVGPQHRTSTAAAFDSSRGRFVLHGGQTNMNLGDVWEYHSPGQ
jgi:hypothetical protein